MNVEPDHCLYRLVDESTRKHILSARDLVEFFGERDERGHHGVVVVDIVADKYISAQDLSDTELQVVDAHGHVIGSYYVGQVTIPDLESYSELRGLDVQTLFQTTCPYTAARPMWRRWASRRPLEPSEWMKYPSADHSSWMHVVQNAWAQSGHRAARYGTERICRLDGTNVVGEDSLYCALGEAVNGTGGYFGWTLDGLDDCLGVPPGTEMFELLWTDFSKSVENAGTEAIEVVKVLQENGVRVSTPGGSTPLVGV